MATHNIAHLLKNIPLSPIQSRRCRACHGNVFLTETYNNPKVYDWLCLMCARWQDREIGEHNPIDTLKPPYWGSGQTRGRPRKNPR